MLPIVLCLVGVLAWHEAALGQPGQNTVNGIVVDAASGQPIANALVRADLPGSGGTQETKTRGDGRFVLPVEALPERIRVATVGYRPVEIRLAWDMRFPVEMEVRLVSDTLQRREAVTVTTDVFTREEGTAVGLAGAELRNLASVLADDPLRAVQGLPGVAANDGFQSQFTLRGAGFARLGIYLDGILLRAPFHAVQGESSSASLTILNGDFLESLELYAGGPPPQFMDRTAGAVDVRTRPGDAEEFRGRFTASASNVAATVEGPVDDMKRGSWVASARKSYLQYIINRTTDEPALGFGFWDVQGRGDYALTERHRVSLSLVQGNSGLDRSGAEDRVGRNAVFFSDYRVTLANLASTYTPNSRWFLQNRVAYMRERFDNRNRDAAELASGYHGEWIVNGDNTWSWKDSAPLSFGWSFRRLRDDGYADRLLAAAPFRERLNAYRGTGLRSGGYFQQAASFAGGRLTVQAGGRVDAHSVANVSVVSPSASLRVQATRSTSLHASWGSAAQFPEISQFRAIYGRDSLLPERSIHHQVAVEQRLNERTRLRVEAYNRLDRDLLFRPFGEPRLMEGRVFNPRLDAPLENSLRGYARGLQAFLQRRSANGLTGWISYAYGVARLRDGSTGQRFPADFEQRHTLNVFGSYRVRPTVNLSMRHTYGSGFPVPGYFSGVEGNFRLAATRNQIRIPAYHRTDLRVNKTWVQRRSQTTLFLEVVNLLNRRSVRFEELSGWNQQGVARLNFDRLFPIIPSAGVVVEF